MKSTRTATGLVLASALLALAGCASQTPNGSAPLSGGTAPATSAGSTGSGTTPATGTTTAPAPGGGATDAAGCPTHLTIEAADMNKTACVAVGGTVVLNLTGGGKWDPPEISGDSLTPKTGSAPVTSATSFRQTYTANAAGTVTISSSHRACAASPGHMACQSIVLWKTTVAVK